MPPVRDSVVLPASWVDLHASVGEGSASANNTRSVPIDELLVGHKLEHSSNGMSLRQAVNITDIGYLYLHCFRMPLELGHTGLVVIKHRVCRSRVSLTLATCKTASLLSRIEQPAGSLQEGVASQAGAWGWCLVKTLSLVPPGGRGGTASALRDQGNRQRLSGRFLNEV